MNNPGAGVPPLGVIEHDHFSPLACGACTGSIDPEQPLLYEYLLDGIVDTALVAGGADIRLPPRAWLIDGFHVDCYETLLASVGLGQGGRYVGDCPNSRHRISSPRPLSRCPACAAEIEMRRATA